MGKLVTWPSELERARPDTYLGVAGTTPSQFPNLPYLIYLPPNNESR